MKLSSSVNILFYWSTPSNFNTYQNCFGIGSFNSQTFAFQKSLLEMIDEPPMTVPDNMNFKLFEAKNGPVRVDLDENWRVYVQMSSSLKACIEMIIFHVEDSY